MNASKEKIKEVSPDEPIMQLKHAMKIVQEGSLTMGIRTHDSIILGAARKVDSLAVDRTPQIITDIHSNIIVSFAGNAADARVLIGYARIEAKKHLQDELPDYVETMIRVVSKAQECFTKNSDLRPYYASILIGGFDDEGMARLFQSDPDGMYYEWKVNALGRLGHPDIIYPVTGTNISGDQQNQAVIMDVIRALMKLSSPQDSLEVAMLQKGKPINFLDDKELRRLMDMIKAEM